MSPFKLSLAPRLALAVVSGLLTYPAIKIDSALGPDNYLLVEWWVLLHGLTFGLLVMAPFVTSDRYRALRVAGLAVVSVVIYDLAIRMPNFITFDLDGDLDDFLISGVTGALLVAAALRFIAPLDVKPSYWGFAVLAGIVGGGIFALTFDVCRWDHCSSPWQILQYSFGWVAWQSLVCAAIYSGSGREQLTDPVYGVSAR